MVRVNRLTKQKFKGKVARVSVLGRWEPGLDGLTKFACATWEVGNFGQVDTYLDTADVIHRIAAHGVGRGKTELGRLNPEHTGGAPTRLRLGYQGIRSDGAKAAHPRSGAACASVVGGGHYV